MKSKLTDKWIHSHEEDTEDVMVFRKENFEFPPSRGREKMEFKEDGTFVKTSIKSNCGFEEKKGKFEETSPDEIKINIKTNDISNVNSMKLILDRDTLKIKKEVFRNI